MKSLKSLLSKKFDTMYQASKELGIHAHQLKRWADNEALVDEYGNIFIKSKRLDMSKLND